MPPSQGLPFHAACLFHVEREAQQLSLAVDQAAPSQLLTLNLFPEGWTAAHKVISSLIARLRCKYPGLPLLDVVEQEPRQASHLHMLVRHGAPKRTAWIAKSFGGSPTGCIAAVEPATCTSCP